MVDSLTPLTDIVIEDDQTSIVDIVDEIRVPIIVEETPTKIDIVEEPLVVEDPSPPINTGEIVMPSQIIGDRLRIEKY